jgi:hypothetical protein
MSELRFGELWFGDFGNCGGAFSAVIALIRGEKVLYGET